MTQNSSIKKRKKDNKKEIKTVNNHAKMMINLKTKAKDSLI
jgi:hypothetical protein